MNDNRRHHDEAAADHEALASLLRDADPAAGDTGLDAVQRARMRQAITTAADRHRGDGLWSAGWQAWKQPALAAAALITVLGLALWTLDHTPEGPSREVADGGVTPPVSAPRAPDPAPETVPEPELTTAPDTAAPSSPEPAPAATAASQPENTAVVTVNAPSPPDRQARTVQFIAPRGTRIIWTLDPDFELSTAGGDARQEQRQ